MFQEYAVFPWKTVIENVAFGLQMRGIGKAERLRGRQLLAGAGRACANSRSYYPHQISGGMKQRVSIIRALANDPEVLLMDEPLGALDAQTRIVLQDELLRIWEETRKTVVYITHSLDEAILLGDRVILMTAHPGRLLATFPIDITRPRTVETMNTRGLCRIARCDLATSSPRGDARHGDAGMSERTDARRRSAEPRVRRRRQQSLRRRPAWLATLTRRGAASIWNGTLHLGVAMAALMVARRCWAISC